MNADPDRRDGAETGLGRTVRTTIATAVASSLRHREHHRTTNWLRDVILGGQDGLVNILGIILGVIAGGGSKTVLLAAGFAAAITESISMGAVGYTSSVSQRDYYLAERAREAAEIDTMPEAERQEIREIYATKGFGGDLLERVVDTITANRDSWLSTMMDEELHLLPVQTADIFRSAFVITLATLIGHLIPLLPFVWLARAPALVRSRPGTGPYGPDRPRCSVGRLAISKGLGVRRGLAPLRLTPGLFPRPPALGRVPSQPRSRRPPRRRTAPRGGRRRRSGRDRSPGRG